MTATFNCLHCGQPYSFCKRGVTRCECEAHKRHAKRSKHYKRAHRAVREAIRNGDLVRPDNCEQCGFYDDPAERQQRPRVVAHHDDYAKPLEVRWLCRTDHLEWHRTNGPGLNA